MRKRHLPGSRLGIQAARYHRRLTQNKFPLISPLHPSQTTNTNQGSSKQLHTHTECSGSLGISIHPGSPLGLELNSERPHCVAVRTLGHDETGLDWAGGRAEQRGWSYTWRAFVINLGFPMHGSGVGGWEKQANPSVAPTVTAVTWYRAALPSRAPQSVEARTKPYLSLSTGATQP